MQNRELTARIKVFARDAGADVVGVAPVEAYDDYLTEIGSRISETRATNLDYMIASGDDGFFERLSDARWTLPSVRSIIVLGVYAYDDVAAYKDTARSLRGKIARTYRYYPVVRQIAEDLAAFVRELGYTATYGQDVPLKYVAQRIGLGSYGKNGILLTEEFGSYMGLRDVLTDAPLEPDAGPVFDLCGSCDLCLKACPTGALYAPYKVNARLCLNPITRRENAIETAIRPKMRNWIIGCDMCQEVCPVNRRLAARVRDTRAGFDPSRHASHRLLGGVAPVPALLDLLQGDFPAVVQRNAAIALANVGRGRTEVVSALQRSLDSENSFVVPYVRWALEVSRERGKHADRV